jgi:hypothetical protein
MFLYYIFIEFDGIEIHSKITYNEPNRKDVEDENATQAHYPDSESTSLCSLPLILHALPRSNKYPFYSLWFDPTGTRTHDLLHSRRAC